MCIATQLGRPAASGLQRWLRALIVVLAKKPGLQRFEPTADDDYAAVGGEQPSVGAPPV
jgi:hypothetical protein